MRDRSWPTPALACKYERPLTVDNFPNFTQASLAASRSATALFHEGARMKSTAFLGLALLFAPCVLLASGDSPRFIVNQRSADRAPLPFSEGVLIGNTLYIAGHIGIDPKTDQAAHDPETETKLVMSAVERTVTSAGFTMNDLVSVTVYCTDLGLYETFNTAYKGFFHGHYPARAFIGVGNLLRGAHFEVQGIAIKTKTDR